jgi:DNA-binding PadR family transcriptional regulator
LLVLGVVRMLGEAHGYQVRQALLSWSADRWANVKQGSIYHALKKAVTDNLLEQVQTEESDQGPDRVVYRTTPKGDGEFFFLMNNALGQIDSGPAMFNAALPFLTTVDRRTLIFLLNTRIKQTEGQLETTRYLMDHSIADGEDQAGKPPHIMEMFRYWNATVAGTLDWLRDLVARIEAGEYTFADDGPGAFGSPPARS